MKTLLIFALALLVTTSVFGTITLPVLPMHVAYWGAKFYRSDGSEVTVSPVIQGVTIEGVVN